MFGASGFYALANAEAQQLFLHSHSGALCFAFRLHRWDGAVHIARQDEKMQMRLTRDWRRNHFHFHCCMALLAHIFCARCEAIVVCHSFHRLFCDCEQPNKLENCTFAKCQAQYTARLSHFALKHCCEQPECETERKIHLSSFLFLQSCTVWHIYNLFVSLRVDTI